jgi:hypothetical protein
MNPTPTDNPSSINNNSEFENNTTPNLTPQLENETPLDITIYPSSENSEAPLDAEKIVSSEIISPQNTSAPISENITSSIADFNSPINPPTNNVLINETLPASNSIKNNFTTQKIAVIGGVLIGILIVSGVSVYYLSNISNVPNTESQINTELQKPAITQIESKTPARAELEVSEYVLKIDSVYTKYQNLVTNNPINLATNNPSYETIKFVSDEIFALSIEINELNIKTELVDINNKLYNELNTQVQNYDKLLKEYKSSNAISAQTKNIFLTENKASADRMNLIINEIKSLK